MSFDIDVELRRGEAHIASRFAAPPGLTVLFGPSGIGKSSVLAMIAGLLTPDRGHVRVGAEVLFDAEAQIDIAPEARCSGYVFQDARLFPHLDVRGNLSFGARYAQQGRTWLTFEDAVTLLEIGNLLDRWPRSLSGGEIRRVAIGRALLRGARFLLMDEPLVSLDARRRDEIMTLVERIRDAVRIPILYVTHDPAEAGRLATTIVEMERE